MDDFISLSNRLLNHCPDIGFVLSRQFIGDSWRTLQSRRQWSFRRKGGCFAPPAQYITGTATTNVTAGNPLLVTGVGTAWTPEMVGRQIRIGGMQYPFYTIAGWISATSLLLDKPWKGTDLTTQTYQILQCYFPVPEDFGFFYSIISPRDAYQLYTSITQAELAMMDPQRTSYGQTYAAVFLDYTAQLGGSVGPVIPVTNSVSTSPISTTSLGFSYPVSSTYIVQVVGGGISGVATYQWLRAGQTAFSPVQLSSNAAVDLADGVQIYWPDGLVYVANDLFIINCTATLSSGVPRYELWPAPTFGNYLYPYIYIAKEADLTDSQPQLPPFIANRGEVLLEMALGKCAEYPGANRDKPNVYYNLKQAAYHNGRSEGMINDLERNDEEVGVTNIDYQSWPFAGPWEDGSWQQRHAPFLNG